ncbi:uroporphyrinogen-III synthase [Pusillimonas sp. TS35]|uniref:uroporphyrinogen-III synthase n=1 Tax=Paracandidimonas lactea TaxID=2895524 RepID=UPI00136D1E18|nr:uroporphyrinogen-III synthase [Paracandidimonas lactea]MYN11972.1 uroporphyrinogen-III synthase [Pusillimonas sp. TS35]
MQLTRAFVLLTRPQGKNAALAGRLGDAGLCVMQAPALVITPLAVTMQAVRQARAAQLAVFVSGTAVRAYFRAMDQALGGQGAFRWPAGQLAAAVGAETAAALRGSGRVPEDAILYSRAPDSSHDSESLWPLLAARLGNVRQALIVRGETGREWLGEQLTGAGVQVERMALYRREAAVWGEREQAWLGSALMPGHRCITLLTSSEGVDAVCANIAAFGLLTRWRQACFLAIHPRIAERLQSVLAVSGNGQPPMVQLCQPGEESVYRALLQMASGPSGS